MQHLIWESFGVFLLVTVVLAGGAAYLTGRAAARAWLPNSHIVVYMVILAAASRFIHFALFQEALLSIRYYMVDLVMVLAFALLGKRLTRARQMAEQYSFIFRRTGPLGWERKH